jgi:gliding motility-associated-like protein
VPVAASASACTTIDSVFVLIKPAPVPQILSNSPVCQGSQLLLSCNAGTNYLWSGANGFVSTASSNSINAVGLNAGGLYNLTVTAANACTAATSASVFIKPLPGLSISPSSASLCAGVQSLNLTASGTATLYNWLPNQSISNTVGASVFVWPNSNQSYSVIGSLNGCTAIATTTVFVVPPPNLNLSLSSNSMCAQALNGSPNTITLSAGGASSYTLSTPNYFHNQNPGGPNFPISLLPPFQNTGPATATLYGSNGVCTLSTSAVYTIVPNPSVSVNNPTPVICAGQSYTYTCNGANSFVWSSATPGSTLYTTGGVAVANPSINSVFAVYGGSLGCNSASQSMSITVNPLPTVSITPNPTFVCVGKATTLNAMGNGSSFVWSNTSLPNFNTGAAVLVSPVKQETYSLVASLNNCTNSAVAIVSVMPLPTPSIATNANTLCLNQDLQLSGFGAKYYSWSSPNNFVYSGAVVKIPMYNLSFAGTYTLNARDSNACEARTTTYISLLNLPNAYLKSNQQYYCVPFWAELDLVSNGPTIATSNFNLYAENNQFIANLSLNSSPLSLNPNHLSLFIKEPGKYFIKGNLSAVNSCVNTVVYPLTAYPKPKADFTFSPDKPVENMDEVTFENTSSGATGFNWEIYTLKQSSEKNPSYVFAEAGIYPVVLVASNEFNCSDTSIKAITVLSDFNVYVPNAFSPNGNGLNDTFMPVLRAVQSFEFSVYNRWGEKLFSTNQLNTGWDGTFKGEDCKQDVYVWKLHVKGLSGQNKGYTAEKDYTGQVLLVR